MQDRLLFMGVDSSTRYAIEYAKSIGATTIVTDYRPAETSFIKQMADEYWTIDVKELDILEQQCRKENITGIYAGNHEFCLDMTKELTKRLGLPFYASEEGWNCARNKERFKECCRAVGLDTPRRYLLTSPFQPEILAEIRYPVIVKPADSCSQQGLTLCYSEQELFDAYQLALNFSDISKVIVEDYIDGEEICAHYYIDRGKIILTHINDDLTMTVNEKRNFTLILNQSHYYDEYREKVSDKVEQLIRNLECQNGVAFLQAIYKDGKFYFLEFAYRFDGIGQWMTTKPAFGFSSVELMVNLALGKRCPINWETDVDLNSKGKSSATYLYWAAPGKVARVDGLDEIEYISGVDIIFQRFFEGSEILKTDNMYQVAFEIGVMANDNQELIQKLLQINHTLHLYDENGRDLLIPFENYQVIEA